MRTNANRTGAESQWSQGHTKLNPSVGRANLVVSFIPGFAAEEFRTPWTGVGPPRHLGQTLSSGMEVLPSMPTSGINIPVVLMCLRQSHKYPSSIFIFTTFSGDRMVAQSRGGRKEVAKFQNTKTSISPISPSGEAYKHDG
jgi:hypothetical protein